MVIVFFLSLLFLSFIIFMDANRLNKHVKVAEAMMDKGLSEDEAMELSGCNHWDMPWYKRIFEKYPDLPSS